MSSNYNSINVKQVRNTRVRIEETGTPVNIRDSCHAQTNHCIKQSRVYFPNHKLYSYIEWPYLKRFSVLILIASAFGFFTIDAKWVSLGFTITCAVFLMMFCQHEMVNQKSLPVVLLQPVIESQFLNNTFYEVTITELKGMALANYQAGIGFVQLAHGKIMIQAFNKTAVKLMSRSKCLSRVLLVLFSIMTVYNIYCTVMAFRYSSQR